MNGADPAAVLRKLCHDGARRARGAGLRAELVAIGHQLDRPLQLAVAGAVSVGKSTLINAVLRRPIAPSDAGECTRLVTWYVYGKRDRVIVECKDGSVRELGLVDGRVPVQLGVPPEHVMRLQVELDDPWLREVTLIDTPGANTVSAENEQATRQLLFGDAAAEHAQALLYVLRYVQRFDADTLEEFRALSSACGMTAVNTAAVLTQVDRRGDEEDPWPTARKLARKATTDLGGVVLDVVPVIGLLAETARGRLLGDADVAGLRTLATLDSAEFEDLLLDLDEFTGADGAEIWGPVAIPIRRSLVARLHRYGIRQAVGYLHRHPEIGSEELHRWLAGRSGYGSDVAASSPTATWRVTPEDPDLVRTLAEVLDRFSRHAGRLKAFSAVRRLGQLTGEAQDRQLLSELRAEVDENRPIAAGLRSLRIVAACAAVGRGQLQLSPEMTAELMTLARHDEPGPQLGLAMTASLAAIATAAREASKRWRRVVQLAGGAGGHRARDVLGVLEEIAALAPPPRRPAPVQGPPSGERPVRPPQGGPAPVRPQQGGPVPARPSHGGPQPARLSQGGGQPPARPAQGGQPPAWPNQGGQPPAWPTQSGQPPAGPNQSGQPPAWPTQSGQPPAGPTQSGQPPAGPNQGGQPPARPRQSGQPPAGPPRAIPPTAATQAGRPPAGPPPGGPPQSPPPRLPRIGDSRPPRGGPGGPLPPAALLGRLLGSPALADRERSAVAALLAAPDLTNPAHVATIVGVPAGASRADLEGAAAELASCFRMVLHRPLPPGERRAVQAACDAFESIVHGLRARRVEGAR